MSNLKTMIKHLELVARRHDWHNVFQDFLDIVLCCLAMGAREEKYHEVIKRYDKEELQSFAHAFAELQMKYNEGVTAEGGWVDPLGDFYMEIVSRSKSKWFGQFFTPAALCDIMSRMSSFDTSKDSLLINDPACGSGRTLLSFDRLDASHRNKCFYHAYDLDEKCCAMTAINMFFHGMRGVVVRMNTLSLEVYDGYRVYYADTLLGIRRLNKSQCNSYLFKEKKKVAQKPREAVAADLVIDRKGQMQLF